MSPASMHKIRSLFGLHYGVINETQRVVAGLSELGSARAMRQPVCLLFEILNDRLSLVAKPASPRKGVFVGLGTRAE